MDPQFLVGLHFCWSTFLEAGREPVLSEWRLAISGQDLLDEIRQFNSLLLILQFGECTRFILCYTE
jgi:hypothetical protein